MAGMGNGEWQSWLVLVAMSDVSRHWWMPVDLRQLLQWQMAVVIVVDGSNVVDS